MRARFFAYVCLLGASVFSVDASAQMCSVRFADAFSRVPALGLRNLPMAQAQAEVNAAFGPRPEVCEVGAYARFIDSFQDYAREAMRAPAKQRDGMLRVAIAVAAQGPVKVPFQEGKAAVTLFRQARSNLQATADDVGFNQTPLLQGVLDALERTSYPQAMPPPPPATPPGQEGDKVQAVRVPTTPLPAWAIISLYEMREALNQKNPGLAQGKLEAILKWMETVP